MIALDRSFADCDATGQYGTVNEREQLDISDWGGDADNDLSRAAPVESRGTAQLIDSTAGPDDQPGLVEPKHISTVTTVETHELSGALDTRALNQRLLGNSPREESNLARLALPSSMPGRRPAQAHVLDEFFGKITSLRDGRAYVTLEAEDGTLFHGTRNAQDFTALNLAVGDSFICRTVKLDQGIELEVDRVPLAEVTDEEIDKLRDSLSWMRDIDET